MRFARRSRAGRVAVAAIVALGVAVAGPARTRAATGDVPGGSVLRVSVPEAVGGKTVIGQLTVDRVTSPVFVTAYGCDDGLPTNADGTSARSDLNYDPNASPVASNRLIVQADDNGDVCFYTYKTVAMIVDVNAVTFDTGVSSFANRRTDTRRTTAPVIPADGVLRVSVPEASGGKTVIGQLTVDRVTEPGYVTAYPCAQGIPADRRLIAKSDLNYDPNASPVASNRLVAQADAKGDVCFSTMAPVAMIVDVNGVSDVGIRSFANRRTDTRDTPAPLLPGGGVLRLNVPEAVGNKTVIGQLTVDRVSQPGWVAAYPCAAGLPTGSDGIVSRSDLNYDPNASPVASNRLIVQADANGDVCLQTLRPTALIVDVNGVAGAGISSFPNRRTDTRRDVLPPGSIAVASTPTFPPFTPRPPLAGVAALTGLPTNADVASRAILAVKIDNYGPARPQWGIDQADAVFEENVEGISRFLALFHSRLPDTVGPVRSARTQDIDLLAAMNRPVFAFSGGNPGVDDWIASADRSGVLVDHGAQTHGCYARTPERPGPHNLLLDPFCALATAPSAGPAGPLWSSSASWSAPAGASPDTTFPVAMDGVEIAWTWDAASGTYLRSQDGLPHVAVSGAQLSAANVVELDTVYIPSPVDSRSPNAVTVGTGAGIVHRGGVAVPITWQRDAADQPFTFTDLVTGQPLPLAPGTTFVELERTG